MGCFKRRSRALNSPPLPNDWPIYSTSSGEEDVIFLWKKVYKYVAVRRNGLGMLSCSNVIAVKGYSVFISTFV